MSDVEGLSINRHQTTIQIGDLATCRGQSYRIVEYVDFDTVVGVHVKTNERTPLRIQELQSVAPASFDGDVDQTELTDKDWGTAQKRFDIIKPLLDMVRFGRNDVAQVAKKANVGVATVYRWLDAYRETGSVAGLVPRARGWSAGKSRISSRAEEIIQDVIETYYLTPQRHTDKKTIIEIQRRCHKDGCDVPSSSTIRARLKKVSEKKKLRGQGLKELASNKFTPVPGKFPGADYPLAVVQIDHTPVDILLVDDVYRKPIGRPWITLAMDICTRVGTGYYLSFDPPSGTSVAMCVAHSILPKEDWLQLHNVDARWPVWGFPKKIHVDNGADFRAENLQVSCRMHNINLEYRPVKTPRYGAHIERLLGTFMKEVHDLPGTTFSSVKEKDEYDAEKHAVMTISEFEKWFVTLLCKVYHQRVHTTLGVSPLKKWEEGIFGDSETPGIGIPSYPSDRHSLLLDFLPAYYRTIQPFGVTLDGLKYYAEALRPWIGTTDSDTKKKRQFVLRRDPRDITNLWFYDPDLKKYFQIPFADQSLPSMSLWEHRKIRDELIKKGRDSSNSHEILQALNEMRSHVEKAQEKTKKARRQAQRRRQHEKKASPAEPLPKKKPIQQESDPFSDFVDGDIKPFGGVS